VTSGQDCDPVFIRAAGDGPEETDVSSFEFPGPSCNLQCELAGVVAEVVRRDGKEIGELVGVCHRLFPGAVVGDFDDPAPVSHRTEGIPDRGKGQVCEFRDELRVNCAAIAVACDQTQRPTDKVDEPGARDSFGHVHVSFHVPGFVPGAAKRGKTATT
jgi:hypothetical protein